MSEKLTREDYAQIVQDVRKECNELILKRVREKVTDGREGWLLYGRIVNVLFNSHYQIAFRISLDHDEAAAKEVV